MWKPNIDQIGRDAVAQLDAAITSLPVKTYVKSKAGWQITPSYILRDRMFCVPILYAILFQESRELREDDGCIVKHGT